MRGFNVGITSTVKRACVKLPGGRQRMGSSTRTEEHFALTVPVRHVHPLNMVATPASPYFAQLRSIEPTLFSTLHSHLGHVHKPNDDVVPQPP